MSSNNCKLDDLQRARRLLKVAENASIDEIKQSYRRAARVYHPDGNSGLGDADKFHKIVSAYNIIISNSKNGGPAKPAHSAASWFARLAGALKSAIGAAPFFGRERGGGTDRAGSPPGDDALSLYLLICQLDRPGDAAQQVKAARAIFNSHRSAFEKIALPRLAGASERMRAELIRLLGRVGTDRALEAIASHVTSESRSVCLAAYLALDGAGPSGQALLDRALFAQYTMARRFTGIFNQPENANRGLNAKAFSRDQMRRIKAFTRRTGVPMNDLLSRMAAHNAGSI